MSWSLILVLSNREKGIKMWHFSTLVTGKSTAALLLLWKWRVLAPFKCKFLFEGSCTAVPSGALTIYCLFLYQNTSQMLWTVGHQNHFNFKVIHIRICRCAQVTAVAAVILALPYRNTLQLAVMAMLMLSLLLASLFGFLQSSSVWGKWKKDEAFFWTFSCSGICFIFTSNEAPPTFFFFFFAWSNWEQWVASARQETCVCLALGGWVTSSSCPPHGHALHCADTKTTR